MTIERLLELSIPIFDGAPKARRTFSRKGKAPEFFVESIDLKAPLGRLESAGRLVCFESRLEPEVPRLRDTCDATPAHRAKRNRLPRPARWQRFGTWMRTTGLLKQAIPAPAVVDPSFLPSRCR